MMKTVDATTTLTNAVLLRFEACYGGEIHRYYELRSRRNIREPDRPHHTDPPF